MEAIFPTIFRVCYINLFIQGYGHEEDVNGANYLKQDHIVRHITGGKAIDHQAAGYQRYIGLKQLVLPLMRILINYLKPWGQSVMKAHQQRRLKEINIDMDSLSK